MERTARKTTRTNRATRTRSPVKRNAKKSATYLWGSYLRSLFRCLYKIGLQEAHLSEVYLLEGRKKKNGKILFIFDNKMWIIFFIHIVFHTYMCLMCLSCCVVNNKGVVSDVRVNYGHKSTKPPEGLFQWLPADVGKLSFESRCPGRKGWSRQRLRGRGGSVGYEKFNRHTHSTQRHHRQIFALSQHLRLR